MVTDKDIKHVISTCYWRDDYTTGRKSRYLSDVICRGMCLPCMRVIEAGKCPELQELFKEEGSKND